MTMLPLKGIIFIILNVVRLVSVISLLFVFSSVIYLIDVDSKAYKDATSSPDFNSYKDEYCYFPDTEVPTSTGGLFWLEFDRFNILCITLLGVASELSFGILNNFFTFFLPILGPSFSTAPLGIIQIMTATILLSHYQEGFPLGSFWLLFVVGLLNLFFGIGFRSRMKLRRSLFRSKREMWERKTLNDDGESGRRFISAKKTLQSLVNTSIDLSGKKDSSKSSTLRDKDEQLVESIDTPWDAFAKQATPGYTRKDHGHQWKESNSSLGATSNMLRELARKENLRIETEQEMGEKEKSPLLQDAFKWGMKRGIPIARSESAGSIRGATTKEKIQQGQAGMSRDLSRIEPHPRDRDSGKFKAAFQRRSLVLSRMVEQVKRGSGASYRKKRASRIPPLPLGYAKKLIAPRQAPGAWVEVEKNGSSIQPPSNTYQPGRSTVAFEDIGSESGRTRYHSINTPIANQFSYQFY